MIRTGIGFDAHRLISGRKLVLGGVTVEHDQGLEGHSDADVLCHAITDGLLGAVAEGDIGQMFPDSDPQWKDADSLELLKMAMERINAKGWNVVNVDSTIIAEQPKLLSYIDGMRANIAASLSVSLEQVSVKATTVEGMGALGRKEGIGAMSIVTVAQTQ